MKRQFILEQGPQETDSGSIYGRTDIFEIPQRGYIKMMYLKVIYTSPTIPLVTSRKANRLAFEAIDSVMLNSEGSAFCYDDHVYSQCRLAQLQYDAHKQVEGAASTTGNSVASGGVTTVTVIRPLFFSAFDNGNRLLADDGLTVSARTKASYQEMTFSGAPTSLSLRLKIVYEQAPEYIPRPLKNTYNARATAPITIPANTTSYRLKLNCPFDVIAIMFMLKSNDANVKFKSVNLTYPNGEYGLFENNTDFSLEDTGSMEHTDSVYIVNFGTRGGDGFTKMNKGLNPTIADLTFASSAVVNKLYCVYEYRSTLEYSNGRIVELITDTTL